MVVQPSSLLPYQPVLSLLSLMFDRHAQELELLLHHHSVTVTQAVVGGDIVETKGLSHEVQYWLFLVEGRVALVHIED